MTWALGHGVNAFIILIICSSGPDHSYYRAPSLGSSYNSTLQPSSCLLGSWLSHVMDSGHKNMSKSGLMTIVLEMFYSDPPTKNNLVAMSGVV